MTVTVLIAEDAPDVADAVAFGARMTWPGSRVIIAPSGAEALQRFAECGADVVILDVSMPAPDGFAVCRQLREISTVPILMLTVRDSTIDKVRALELGADDFVSKPFDPLELFARLRALLRRAAGHDEAPSSEFVFDGFTLNSAIPEVRVDGHVVRLTPTEYQLLVELVRHAGAVIPHPTLLERIWGPMHTHDVQYLKVFVRRLRRKLGDPTENPRYVQTEWGVGYRFGPRRERASQMTLR